MTSIIKPFARHAHGIMLILGMAPFVSADLPDPGMTITPGNTALVITFRLR